jgi:hypothetical protein
LTAIIVRADDLRNPVSSRKLCCQEQATEKEEKAASDEVMQQFERLEDERLELERWQKHFD